MSARAAGTGSQDVALQVRQTERALREIYVDTDLIDVSDLSDRPAEESDPRILSRALTAQAVRIVTGLSPQDAALTITDGHSDQGIDAIAIVSSPNPHVYLVQGKWSKGGVAKCERSAVMELMAGLRLIDDEDFAAFNPRGQQLAPQAKSVMSQGAVPITQVIVLMRADDVTDGFMNALLEGERDFNRFGDVLDHRIILAPEVWESVRRDRASNPVEIQAELFPWFSIGSRYKSLQGVVTAEQVAEWVKSGDGLFSLNIRSPLGRTPINNELITTLIEEPANFWYFNNGVTILCESLTDNPKSLRAPHSLPVSVVMENASVVNGAQTVRSIAEAVASDEVAASAQISVRIIETGKAADFAKRTTQATNRQNRVEPRDFIALDPVQSAVLDEMRAELGLEYGVRRGELEPPEDSGCSVTEAACALACAHHDSQYVARMAADLDVLWGRGNRGIYEALFRPQPGVYLLWNAVRVLRTVRQRLYRLRTRYERRGAALIEHGAYLLAHLVFQRLDTEGIDEPDPTLEWSERSIQQVPELLDELLPRVLATIDNLYSDRSQIRAVCSDVGRCREVVTHVLTSAQAPDAQAIVDTYRRDSAVQRRRRPNAVSILIDKGVLDEGARLTLADGSGPEIAAMRAWLDDDERRGRGRWTRHRSKPILWSADGKQYSPSGLITHMWEMAGWESHPVAVQGTARWTTADGETLADLAWRILEELDEPDDSAQETDDEV